MKLEQIDRKLDKLLSDLRAIHSWTNEKKATQSALVSFVTDNDYICFGNTYESVFGLQGVGDEIILDLPPTRKGYLSIFKGNRVRIICIGSGTRWNRWYAAGLTSKQITRNYADVVRSRPKD